MLPGDAQGLVAQDAFVFRRQIRSTGRNGVDRFGGYFIAITGDVWVFREAEAGVNGVPDGMLVDRVGVSGLGGYEIRVAPSDEVAEVSRWEEHAGCQYGQEDQFPCVTSFQSKRN